MRLHQLRLQRQLHRPKMKKLLVDLISLPEWPNLEVSSLVHLLPCPLPRGQCRQSSLALLTKVPNRPSGRPHPPRLTRRTTMMTKEGTRRYRLRGLFLLLYRRQKMARRLPNKKLRGGGRLWQDCVRVDHSDLGCSAKVVIRLRPHLARIVVSRSRSQSHRKSQGPRRRPYRHLYLPVDHPHPLRPRLRPSQSQTMRLLHLHLQLLDRGPTVDQQLPNLVHSWTHLPHPLLVDHPFHQTDRSRPRSQQLLQLDPWTSQRMRELRHHHLDPFNHHPSRPQVQWGADHLFHPVRSGEA